MADYWISQPRHYCEFCKCWIADNKPSKDFHEKGKKHQQNVKLKIDQVRKKGFQDALKKDEMADSLREMEEAAIRALKTDLTKDPSMAKLYGVTLKPKKIPMIGPANKPVEETVTPPGETTSTCDWQEAWTPEGYVYYWNTKGERTWEKPEGYVSSWERAAEVDKLVDEHLAGNKGENDSESSDKESTTSSQSAEHPSHGQGKEHSESESQSEDEDLTQEPVLASPKDVSSVELPSLQDIPLPPVILDSGSDQPPLAKIPKLQEADEWAPSAQPKAPKPTPKHWAYGAWESCKIEEPTPVDLQLPYDESQQPTEPIPDIPEAPEEPKIKFRQKKVDTLGQELVAFRKRKMKARLQGLRKKDADS